MNVVFVIFALVLLPASAPAQACKSEMQMRRLGLVDLQQEIPGILVELRYSGSNNFLGRDIYQCLERAFAHKLLVEKLRKADKLIRKKYPSYHLLVFDAARPLHCQKALWDALPMPESRKHIYVAKPARGSIHNFGLAIDLSLADENGRQLDMGTDFDFFGELAQPRCEKKMLQAGRLTKRQIHNRLILRNAMKQSGFSITSSEWWHFNACSLRHARKNGSIIP